MEEKDQCTSGQQDVSKSTKVKPRPPKLKNPLESVLQSELDFSSGHRPIGTPPPASLRRSRQSFDLSSTGVCDPLVSTSFSSTSPTSSDNSEFFPRINVENSSETELLETASCDTAFPALNDLTQAVMDDPATTANTTTTTTANHTKRPPIDNQRRSLSVDNNNPIDVNSPKGLSPPQRLMTRDQDGIVFELTGGSHPSNN